MRSAEPAKTYQEYELREETANIITHGIGVLLGLVGFGLLLARGLQSGNTIYTLTVSIYSTTLLWTYCTSTLYHSAYKMRVGVKNTLHLLDHTAIYLFIAGTYTPVACFALPEDWRNPILISIWVLAISGVIFKVFSIGRLNWLSTVFYLLMGWMIIIAARPLLHYADLRLIYWILGGGLCYSLGVVFFLWEKLPYSHAIWHVWVLAGSLCHFIAIYAYLDI